MAQRFHQRPSDLHGISDPYAAYCFDEAVYIFGTHVEAELSAVSTKAKTPEEAANSRRNLLMQLLYDPPDADGNGSFSGYVHDPSDPVSEETARKMPPPVRFSGQKFLDPALTFQKAASRSKDTT